MKPIFDSSNNKTITTMSQQVKAQITAALKELGINSRMVSVRVPHHGAVSVTIRDSRVDYGTICKITKQFEQVNCCDYSGDILAGGNTFVSVYTSTEADAGYAKFYLEQVSEALANVGRRVKTEIGEAFLAQPSPYGGFMVEMFAAGNRVQVQTYGRLAEVSANVYMAMSRELAA